MKKNSLLILSIISFVVASTYATAGNKYKKRYIQRTLHAEPVNAFNERLGQPVSELRFFGEITIARENGVCGTEEALPIDENTSLDAKLCTYADPFSYLAFDGIDVADVDPSLQNIPLSSYPHLTDHFGGQESLPQVDDAEWYEYSNGSQIENYTVGQWLKASGEITFKCGYKKNSYEFTARDMVPGGLYSLFVLVFDQEEGMLTTLPRPLGGASANTFVADNKGKISGERFLNACVPTIPQDDRFQMVNIFVAYHSDGNLYGGTATQSNVAPFAGRGMTELPQLQFTIPSDF